MQGIKKDIELQNEINKLKEAGGATQTVQDNLVLNNSNNTTTSVAIYGINVIKTSTATDKACKLPIATTGRSTTFINNSTLPIFVFPSAIGGSINNVVNGMATIPNDGQSYTFHCYENPLPGAWTWSPPATTQYDSGEITCDTVAGSGMGRYNVGISDNYHQQASVSGATSTYWVFDCQVRDLIASYAPNYDAVSAGDTGGVSGTALSATPMNVTKIKIYTNAKVGATGWMFAGLNVSCGTSLYDSDLPGGNFITNGPASALSGVISTTGETWSVVPDATLSANTLSPNIGDPGTYYITWDPGMIPGFDANYINLGPPQYLGPNTTPGEYVWYMGAWSFFIKPDVNFTDFKYRFIIEYS